MEDIAPILRILTDVGCSGVLLFAVYRMSLSLSDSRKFQERILTELLEAISKK